MKKVATYMRVSNHSASKESLRKQTSEVNEYCANKGYNVEDTVSVVGDRELGYEMLMKMLSGAKEKGIDTVIMYICYDKVRIGIRFLYNLYE